MFNKKITKVQVKEALDIMNDWDFSLTKRKLQETSASWTDERADKAIEDYKKYLAITKTLDGVQLVPNAQILK